MVAVDFTREPGLVPIPPKPLARSPAKFAKEKQHHKNALEIPPGYSTAFRRVVTPPPNTGIKVVRGSMT